LQVLTHGGNIDHRDAEATALQEYAKFDERRKLARKAAVDEEYASLKSAERDLPTGRGARR